MLLQVRCCMAPLKIVRVFKIICHPSNEVILEASANAAFIDARGSERHLT